MKKALTEKEYDTQLQYAFKQFLFMLGIIAFITTLLNIFPLVLEDHSVFNGWGFLTFVAMVAGIYGLWEMAKRVAGI